MCTRYLIELRKIANEVGPEHNIFQMLLRPELNDLSEWHHACAPFD
jgi:hypothetical protein